MNFERAFIGVTIALLCLLGLRHDRWFLLNTKKGRRLTRWFGEDNALWVLRGLLMTGIAFGVFLATGVIAPVQW